MHLDSELLHFLQTHEGHAYVAGVCRSIGYSLNNADVQTGLTLASVRVTGEVAEVALKGAGIDGTPFTLTIEEPVKKLRKRLGIDTEDGKLPFSI